MHFLIFYGPEVHLGECDCTPASTSMPNEEKTRHHLGQKIVFRINKERFEMLVGFISGDLLPVIKTRKWSDKIDLAVSLRDVLLNEGIKKNV